MTAGGEAPFSPLLHLAWARSGELPDHDDWLSAGECAVLRGLRMPKRRADWRLGRWVAKEAVASVLGPMAPSPDAIEVVAGPFGAPEVRMHVPGGPRLPRVSLSHAEGWGFATASLEALPLGCDLEVVATRSASFVADYLTDAEQVAVAASPELAPVLVNLAWSAKESALKALGEGLRLDTRSVEVDIVVPGADWLPLSVRAPGPALRAWCRVGDGFVWTVAQGASKG